MKMLYFIISNLILIVPIIYVFRYKGDKFLGLNISKGWFLGLIILELIWLVFCWYNYQSSVDDSIANDFLWHNQFNYYRGVLPIAGLMNIKDFPIKANSLYTLITVYLLAIIVDYIILRIFSFFVK